MTGHQPSHFRSLRRSSGTWRVCFSTARTRTWLRFSQLSLLKCSACLLALLKLDCSVHGCLRTYSAFRSASMCGIFAYHHHQLPRTKQHMVDLLLAGLRRLEYRGYDSAGLSISAAEKSSVQENCTKQRIIKSSGKFSCLVPQVLRYCSLARWLWFGTAVPYHLRR